MSRRFDERLQQLDLNNGQFSMLTVIAGFQPVTIQELAEHLAMDRTTATAALKPLVRRGLVEVRVSESDSRSRNARLTVSGQAVLVEAIPIWEAMQQEAEALLPKSEVSRLRRNLTALN